MAEEKTLNTVKLDDCKCTVELIDELKWGQKEKINEALYSGIKLKSGKPKSVQDAKKDMDADAEFDATALTRSTYVAIEVCVKKITDNNGNKVEFTRDWLDNLSIADGDKLNREVNKITEGEKNRD